MSPESSTRNVREVEEGLLEVVPAEFRKHAHHWLILHGRYVCKARKPDCPICPIRRICLYPDKTRAPGLPARRISASARRGR